MNEPEYILCADETSEVILSTHDRKEVVHMAQMIRRGGGQVTAFKSIDDELVSEVNSSFSTTEETT